MKKTRDLIFFLAGATCSYIFLKTEENMVSDVRMFRASSKSVDTIHKNIDSGKSYEVEQVIDQKQELNRASDARRLKAGEEQENNSDDVGPALYALSENAVDDEKNKDFSEVENTLDSELRKDEELISIAQYDSLNCGKGFCELQYNVDTPDEVKAKINDKMIQFFKRHQEFGTALETNVSEEHPHPHTYRFVR